MNNSVPKPRIRWIDSLRGIAALSVIIHHYVWETLAHNPDFLISTIGGYGNLIIKNYFNFGLYGVAIFFLISGYIIPATATRPQIRPFLSFWTSRIFRLYPAYWLSVIAASIIISNYSVYENLVNLTMAQRFVGVPDVQGIYWTLQVELIFYAIVSLLLLRSLLNHRLMSVIGSIIALALSLALSAVRFFADIKAPLAVGIGLSLMFAGSFYYCFYQRGIYSRREATIYYVSFFAVLCLVVTLGYEKDWGYNESPSRFIISYLCAFGTFLAFSNIPRLSISLLSFLGLISYSSYLLHGIIQHVLPFDNASGAQGFMRIGGALFVTVCVSTLLFFGVEKPMIGLGKRISNKWNPKIKTVV